MRLPALLSVLAVLTMLTACADQPKADPKPAAKPVVPGSVMAIRVNCGSDREFTDQAGLKWSKDQMFKEGAWGRVGGNNIIRDKALTFKNTYASELYQAEAFGMKAYRFTLPNGTYTVQLHFSEGYEDISAPGQRVFSVAIEGKPVLTDLDLYKEVGPYAAMVKAYEVKLVDGVLDIEFTPKAQNPQINAIEILQP